MHHSEIRSGDIVVFTNPDDEVRLELWRVTGLSRKRQPNYVTDIEVLPAGYGHTADPYTKVKTSRERYAVLLRGAEGAV